MVKYDTLGFEPGILNPPLNSPIVTPTGIPDTETVTFTYNDVQHPQRRTAVGASGVNPLDKCLRPPYFSFNPRRQL